jgi:hypothetical protein
MVELLWRHDLGRYVDTGLDEEVCGEIQNGSLVLPGDVLQDEQHVQIGVGSSLTTGNTAEKLHCFNSISKPLTKSASKIAQEILVREGNRIHAAYGTLPVRTTQASRILAAWIERLRRYIIPGESGHLPLHLHQIFALNARSLTLGRIPAWI